VRRPRPRPPTGDDGFSLTELLVAMGIASVVGIVFTTGILQIYRTASSAEGDSVTQQQLGQALIRLDLSLRYAYSIGTVHTEGTAPYVEFLTRAQDSTTSGFVQRCVQLRLTGTDSQNLALQTRYWNKTATAAQPSAWLPLATQLTTLAGAAPFIRVQPTATANHQLLTVQLGARSSNSVKSSAITFTALNTYASTAFDASGKPVAATTEPCYDTGART
jgi:prepilin-type N-terminal cleavage/methylation domain-containing protein